MPLVEIDDAVLPHLATAGVAYKDRTGDVAEVEKFRQAYAKILEGPHRREMLAVLKKQYPDLAIPEIDAANPVIEQIAAIDKKMQARFDEWEKKEKDKITKDHENSAKQTISKGREYLRSQGCDDEGIESVEKLMQENNLANYEIAFSHYDRQQPKQVSLPTTYGGTALDWFSPDKDDNNHKLLLEDPVKWKNQEVAKFFQEKAAGKLQLAG